MKTFNIGLLAGALAIASSTSLAADTGVVLASVQAPVMVNQGEAYVDAQDSMPLNTGDRLMVMRGGNAQIQFANGCVQNIRANEIVTVGTSAACNTATSAGTYNQVGSGGTSTGGSPTNGSPTGVEWAGIAGIAGVGGYIVYKILDDDDDSDRNPASP
ncbi:hypothetical protein EY643_02560 [Halioglobus maricola]|uniref:Uncharacterized protein n=1 Tax=Halioglobus maricola TaxID=2601894 RepID=A0A5P9NHE1_9GAMM|nr:hypothetical protein [Halioglobus maricola]QFU74624.1 hypothetical protein EY643_02560 [Halioglobus maricola]